MPNTDIIEVLCDNGKEVGCRPEWTVEYLLTNLDTIYSKRGCHMVDGLGRKADPDESIGSLVPPIRLTGGQLLTRWQGNVYICILKFTWF